MARAYLIIALLWGLALKTLAQSHCGSLITYRQHARLLSQDDATCLRDGCADPTSAVSLSSQCSSDSPCHLLWDIIRNQSQTDWCSSCKGDLACRISGWPVLNMTAVCDLIPHQWVFYGGKCCVAGEEPFSIADWIGSLCNGSEWRASFGYYGGMASVETVRF